MFKLNHKEHKKQALRGRWRGKKTHTAKPYYTVILTKS